MSVITDDARWTTAAVVIVLGSESDLEKVTPLLDALNEYRISYSILFISAHRNKEELDEFVAALPGTEVRFIVAVAGMAAHLGGAIACQTTLPVFGIPVPSRNDPDGLAAKFAMSELPQGPAQVAVLADNVLDNCNRIANLIGRFLAGLNHPGFASYAEGMRSKKPAEVRHRPPLK